MPTKKMWERGEIIFLECYIILECDLHVDIDPQYPRSRWALCNELTVQPVKWENFNL